jgi:shikimate dehydrogenase
VPHKEPRWHCRSRTIARVQSAANTLWYDDDTLRSTNTDVEGFCQSRCGGADGIAA